jgi:hypothetical protein
LFAPFTRERRHDLSDRVFLPGHRADDGDGAGKILVDARAGNEARNVTGALVFVEGVFLQILEGDKTSCGR